MNRQKSLYEECIREVERGSFTPLVFSTTGGASRLASTFLRHLASLLAEKHDKPYSATMAWLHCRLSFSLLRSAVLCMRGSCSTARRVPTDFGTIHIVPDLVVSQAQL